MDGSDGKSNSQRATRDPEYYFTNVVFQVGSSIFRVPRHGFEVPGTPFEAMFKLPANDSGPEGSSDDNPIVLEQIDEHDFRGFLRVLYPRPAISPQDWIGALTLATKWEFEEVRNKAIDGLSSHVLSQKAADTIILAKKCRVADWLREAYARLAAASPLPLSEVAGLDWQTQTYIYYIRDTTKDQATTKRRCYHCRESWHFPGIVCSDTGAYSRLVEEVFKEEFRAMGPPPPLPQPAYSIFDDL